MIEMNVIDASLQLHPGRIEPNSNHAVLTRRIIEKIFCKKIMKKKKSS